MPAVVISFNEIVIYSVFILSICLIQFKTLFVWLVCCWGIRDEMSGYCVVHGNGNGKEIETVFLAKFVIYMGTSRWLIHLLPRHLLYLEKVFSYKQFNWVNIISHAHLRCCFHIRYHLIPLMTTPLRWTHHQTQSNLKFGFNVDVIKLKTI